jgi:hypothetical protein
MASLVRQHSGHKRSPLEVGEALLNLYKGAVPKSLAAPGAGCGLRFDVGGRRNVLTPLTLGRMVGASTRMFA